MCNFSKVWISLCSVVVVVVVVKLHDLKGSNYVALLSLGLLLINGSLYCLA